MKKFFALVLAIMMVMSLAVPAAADEAYTITITNSDAISSAGHKYEAYQIFKGVLDTTGTILTEIQWGESIDENADDFLVALKAIPDGDNRTNLPFMRKSGEQEVNIFASCVTAQDVADILSKAENQTEAILNTFAKHATTNLEANSAIGVSTQIDAPYTISIPKEKCGYYLVKDTLVDDPNDLDDMLNKDISDYILQVVGDVSVEHKGSIPTMEKKVSETGATYHDSIATGINETHYYRITAELPDDYRLFDTYYLEFTDTMSSQLTFDNVVEVKALIRSSGAEVTIHPDCYTVTPAQPTAGANLKVVIADTKTVKAADTTKAAIILNSEDAIEVIYKAHVNDTAVVDGSGIPNEASIIYSNDPTSGGHGESTPDKTHVYPINLKLIKVDGQNGETLDGAKFLLIRQHSDGSTSHDEYAVVGDNGKINKWVHHYVGDDCVTGDTKHADAVTANELGTILETDVNGEINVKGLDAGRYELEEIAPPDGYNALAERIIVTTSITVDETTNKISGMTGTTNQGSITYTVGDATVILTIPNHMGEVLPSTGGMGTTLFYVIGSVLVMGALVMLITKKRMAAEN